jgi:molybdopterin-guanine dinucleotide biosynthesis protein A
MAMVPETVWGLVLAGGKSRRMGRDKALLRQDGQTQLSRAVALLEAQLDRVFVSTRPDQDDDAERARFDRIVDRYSDMGPLAGILSAIDTNGDVAWLVLACDLPNVDADTITCLIDNSSAAHVATAFNSIHDGLPEPLCAVYRPAVRPVIDEFVARGIVCPRKILLNSKTHLLAQPNPGALHNINSPDDLAGTAIESAS